VRWALEEVGQNYDVRYLRQGEQKEAGHRKRQPYGQVPTLEEGDLTLFESGAIVHHIASTRPGLFPTDPAGRARTIEWMFAALNTIEPLIMDLSIIDLFEADKPWSKQRRPSVEARIRERLRGDAKDVTALIRLIGSGSDNQEGSIESVDPATILAYLQRATAQGGGQ
jgi:glutathione S-transferase